MTGGDERAWGVGGTWYSVLAGLVCGLSLLVPGGWTVLAAGNDGMTVLGKVTAVDATGLVRRQASFFDLEGRTVTFTPDGAAGYAVQVGPLTWVETDEATARSFDIGERPDGKPPSPFDDRFNPRWRQNNGGENIGLALPFAFPFAGRTWTHVHANTNGNLSFLAPETAHWQHRDPWPAGSMRGVAAAVDARSAAGLEAMIAGLWSVYERAVISVDSTPSRVAITWNAVRSRDFGPTDPNVFQIRLHPSGMVELAYREVSERDGIVGLFHGMDARGRTLSVFEDTVGDVSDPFLDVVSARLVDNGTTVIFSLTVAGNIPERVDGLLVYRANLNVDGRSCVVELQVRTTGRNPFQWCGPAPALGYSVQGRTLEIAIPKILFDNTDTISWAPSAVWWGPNGTLVVDGVDGEQSVSLPASDHDLSSMAQTVAGNLFEVFHYISITKSIPEIMSIIYGQVPADDEMAVPLTDFRFDGLFAAGGSSGTINAPVQGIGDGPANPGPGSVYGSDSLLVATQPRFVGEPVFRESGFHGDLEFRDHALGIWWIGHELGHRWGVSLGYRDPESGRIEPLTGDGCRCHWSLWLHAPVVHPVWRGYTDQPYPEASNMGGVVWVDHGDGTFTRQWGSHLANGLSALDLYTMGMIPPAEVGPTFLLRDAVETGTPGRFRATKVPVRIEDIVAAMGPRVPPASEQRRVFRLGVYLLHEGSRAPRTDLFSRSQSLTEATTRYFARATGMADANRAPGAVRTLPDRTLGLNGALDVNVSQAFVDPDGDALSFEASSTAPNVVTARASGARVTLTAAAAGTATIRVTATDPGGLSAAQSFTVTVKATAAFTDDPIQPGVTPIRAVHFTELRSRIDALRAAAGLARFGWTDAVITAGVTPVRRVHLTELRSALAAAYAAAGRTAPRWTDAVPAGGTTPVRAVHVMELRTAVMALE